MLKWFVVGVSILLCVILALYGTMSLFLGEETFEKTHQKIIRERFLNTGIVFPKGTRIVADDKKVFEGGNVSLTILRYTIDDEENILQKIKSDEKWQNQLISEESKIQMLSQEKVFDVYANIAFMTVETFDWVMKRNENSKGIEDGLMEEIQFAFLNQTERIVFLYRATIW